MILFAFLALQVAAFGTADDAEGCTDKAGARALSACYSDHAELWEPRMEDDYAAALKSPHGYNRAALRTAQAKWLSYRQAECGFYGKAEGTLAYVDYSYCMLDLTRKRALELEAIPLP